MPCTETIADVIRNSNNGLPMSLTNPLSATTFKLANGAIGALVTPNPAVIISGESFPQYTLNALPINITLAGFISFGTTAGGTCSIAIDLGLVAGTTPIVPVTASQSTTTAISDNFMICASLMWDPVSLLIRGNYSGWVGSTNVAASQATSQTAANIATLQYTANAIFQTTAAANTISVTEFSMAIGAS